MFSDMCLFISEVSKTGGGQRGLAQGNPSHATDSGLFFCPLFPTPPLWVGEHHSGEIFCRILGAVDRQPHPANPFSNPLIIFIWELAGPLQTPNCQSSWKWQKIGQKVPKSFFGSLFCLFLACFGVYSVFLSCRGSRCSQILYSRNCSSCSGVLAEEAKDILKSPKAQSTELGQK